MRGFIVIAIMAVAVSARPEPPSGYNYRAPAQISGGGVSAGGGYANGGFQAGGFNGNNGGYTGNGASGGFQAGGFNGNNGGYTGNGASGGFNSGSGFNGGFNGGQGQGQTIVQKHIYVHVPPPEEEAAFAPQQIAPQAPRKHYKIIFIKTPSAPSYAQQIAAAQAQSQEKTLIYVLVKKPEEFGDIQAPAAVAAPVSKPEVYFIKYKTQKQGGGGGFGPSGGAIDNGSFNQGVAPAGNTFSNGQSDYQAPNPAPAYGVPHKK